MSTKEKSVEAYGCEIDNKFPKGLLSGPRVHIPDSIVYRARGDVNDSFLWTDPIMRCYIKIGLMKLVDSPSKLGISHHKVPSLAHVAEKLLSFFADKAICNFLDGNADLDKNGVK